ncbi:MAG: class I SAM-dependent methyltransferase [Candidatus Zixiibacteriota bacterium]|nr:MAG: class I SAM-dependent methyltransferase [candidate division Zixibacteria bacterium]
MLDFKQTVRVAFRKIGYEIAKLQPPLGDGYEEIRPLATYAPWLKDGDFIKTFEAVFPYTMVDKYRCYELWMLIPQVLHIDGAILEVGTWKGGTGGIICQRAKLLDLRKNIYLADTFTGVPKASEKDSRYVGGEHNNASEKELHELLKSRLKLDNYKLLKGVFPDETVHLISDDKFCFCHIDVDVYDSAKDIVDWIWPRLQIGGIIVYDDYGYIACNGITDFVNEQQEMIDRNIIYNLNGHAVVTKLRDISTSEEAIDRDRVLKRQPVMEPA